MDIEEKMKEFWNTQELQEKAYILYREHPIVYKTLIKKISKTELKNLINANICITETTLKMPEPEKVPSIHSNLSNRLDIAAILESQNTTRETLEMLGLLHNM